MKINKIRLNKNYWKLTFMKITKFVILIKDFLKIPVFPY